MAFIRAFGGGGIPSALKSAMNAVLNKKFGTSTIYAPEDWAPSVNLLGPLPEKTVSGSIANLSDGAGDVPVKSAKFHFSPQQAAGSPSPSNPLAITGWTGLTGYQFGKNLFDKVNGNIVTGYIATSSFNDGNTRAKTVYVPIKGGLTYTVSKTAGQRFQIATSEYIPTNGALYTTRQTGNTSSSLTITAGANDNYLWAWIFLEGTDTGTLDDMLASVQIEVGASATSYEAFKTPEVVPVSWSDSAGILYCGYVDATRGKVVKTHGSVDLGTLDWTITQTLQEERAFYTEDLASVIDPPASSSGVLNGFCEILPAESVNEVMNLSGPGICSNSSGRVYIFNYTYTSMTKEQFTTAVTGSLFVYPLATPEEYDITAFIPSTYLGSNNFYSDANGETEVTYRADIDLALAANSSRGLMMASRPVTQLIGEESDLNQVNELVEDENDETEQEGDSDENIRQDPADR